MSESELNRAIVDALRSDREASRRWEPVRTAIVEQLKISDDQADETLVFIEASAVDRYLGEACEEWAAAEDPEWRAKWQIAPILDARREAFLRKQQAIHLLTQHFQCTELQAHSLVKFLTATAQGYRFYDVARLWVQRFGGDWRELSVAAIGRTLDSHLAEAFGRILTEMLNRHAMSDEEAAARSGLKLQEIREFKAGRFVPMLEELVCIAPVFNMVGAQLLERIEKDAAVLSSDAKADRSVERSPSPVTPPGEQSGKMAIPEPVEHAIETQLGRLHTARSILISLHYALEYAHKDKRFDAADVAESTAEMIGDVISELDPGELLHATERIRDDDDDDEE